MKNNPKDNKAPSNNLFLNEPKQDTHFSKSTNQLAVVSNNGYRIASTALPENFFENLLILEMELEDEFDLEKLIELVKQYSIAIEYYLQFEPNKAKAYQNRMEYLLTNKDTLVKLKKQKDKEKNINDDNINKNINIDKENELRKKYQRMKSQLNVNMDYIKIKQNEINEEDFAKKANLFLSSNKKSEEQISGKDVIKEDLKNQSESWKKKYKLKKKISNFSMKPNLIKSKPRYFGDSMGDKHNLKSSVSPLFRSANLSINNHLNIDLKVSKFNSSEFKNEIKEENIILEENNEKAKKGQDLINNIKIKENNEEEVKNENENNKENNDEKENEKDKNEINIEIKIEEKNEIKEEDKTEEKKVDEKKEEKREENVEEKKEEKKEENEEENKEIKTEIIIEEKNPENESKQEQNEIKEEAPQNEEKAEDNIDYINIAKLTENNLESDDNKTPSKAERRLSMLFERNEQMNNEELEKEITDKIILDEEIKSSIESQITSLQNIISNLNSKTSSQNDIDNEEEEDSEFSSSNKNLAKVKNNNNISLIEKIPVKFQGAYSYVEDLIHTYMKEFNLFFYKDIFEQFSSSLLELYELKYKKYIEIRNEYHDQIKANEYSMENEDNLTEEKKEEYQQTIESLKEEQQHQIDVVEDEFNKKIMDKISEFKLNSFKHNSGIQLLEEKVKLDIYSLINQAFYN